MRGITAAEASPAAVIRQSWGVQHQPDRHQILCPTPDCPGNGAPATVLSTATAKAATNAAAAATRSLARVAPRFTGLHHAADLMVIVRALLGHGCPVQAIVFAFGLHEDTAHCAPPGLAAGAGGLAGVGCVVGVHAPRNEAPATQPRARSALLRDTLAPNAATCHCLGRACAAIHLLCHPSPAQTILGIVAHQGTPGAPLLEPGDVRAVE